MGEMYIFKCKDCGSKFEMFHLILEPIPEVVCPECGGTEVSRIVSDEHKGALPGGEHAAKSEDDESGGES
ncbi:zinc ribbon domain-containing protein [Thermodesulfobacteriota bacterium]